MVRVTPDTYTRLSFRARLEALTAANSEKDELSDRIAESAKQVEELAARAEQAEAELDLLWAREQPTGVYDAKLLPCRTDQGPVLALAFTLSRRSVACLPNLSDAEVTHILRHARGRYPDLRPPLGVCLGKYKFV